MADMDNQKCQCPAPFIGIPRNVGSTGHYNPKNKSEVESQQYSFGIPSFFFRFSFTSAIENLPYCAVDWVQFTAMHFTRTCFQGHMTDKQMKSSPCESPLAGPGLLNTFINCDEIIPSRFVFSSNHVNNTMAFLALDPERVGDGLLDDGLYTDLGDNILQYKGGRPDLFNGNDFDKDRDGIGGAEGEGHVAQHYYDRKSVPSNLFKFLSSDLSNAHA